LKPPDKNKLAAVFRDAKSATRLEVFAAMIGQADVLVDIATKLENIATALEVLAYDIKRSPKKEKRT
jgi:hypothetical protein